MMEPDTDLRNQAFMNRKAASTLMREFHHTKSCYYEPRRSAAIFILRKAESIKPSVIQGLKDSSAGRMSLRSYLIEIL